MNLIYFRDYQGQLVSLPARWTDRVALDPIIAVSAGRSLFRLEDLLELARLLTELNQRRYRSGMKLPFTATIVARLRRKFGLKSRYDRLRYTGDAMAIELGVTRQTIKT